MTLLELQKILGNEIRAVMGGTADTDKAKAIASLAEQMINNANIVLRTDKFIGNTGERIDEIVGYEKS